MVTNIRHHNAERHSKLSYIMTHKWPGMTLRNLKHFRIIYSVNLGEVNQRVKSILDRHFVNYEAPAVYPEHVISGILHLQRCEVLLQNMIISQRTSLVKSMTKVMKIPLDAYEDLLFVQERLAI